MPWRNAPELFFLRYGAAHGPAQEPTSGSAVEFWAGNVRKNRPLVPRSNIAASWARGRGTPPPPPAFVPRKPLLTSPERTPTKPICTNKSTLCAKKNDLASPRMLHLRALVYQSTL